ncbi:MAG: hypothetical protein PHQ43_00795 [Dehalococcoidales bacterium]|nr:hypothetical protein [Dehalococcoidales bacterium]
MTSKDKYYVQIWAGSATRKTGEPSFLEVEGKPVPVPGADNADLFLHRFVADIVDGKPVYGDYYKISSGATGMAATGIGTKREVMADVQQKGKPQAISRLVKDYIKKGEVLSPRFVGVPKGLSVKKVKSGYEVIHTKSGNRLMPFAYPEKELATDFARRAGQVGVDWTRPFPELQKESEKIADLIRGGEKPGMFEKVLDMPTTFPETSSRKPLKDMSKAELKQLRVILHILPDGTLEIKEKGTDSLERGVASWNPPNRPDMTERSWVGGYIMNENVADNAKKWLDAVAKKYDLDMGEIVADSWRGGGMRHKESPYEYTTNTFTGKVKTTGKTTDLQAIHDTRSSRSRESDERQSNADTIEPDDPRVEQWVRDQGQMDVVGVDTPRKGKGKKGSRKVRKDSGKRVGKLETQLGGLRGNR